MEDFLALFQIRTAIPFGYAIFALGWIGATFAALLVFAVLLWKKRFRSIWLYLSILVLLFNGLVLFSTIYFERTLDSNPRFEEADVIGEWRDGKSSFILFENGEATISLSRSHLNRLQIENGAGVWRRYQDFTIQVMNEEDQFKPPERGFHHPPLLRIIKSRGAYRIIIQDYIDPDMWDGRLGFKKENSQESQQ